MTDEKKPFKPPLPPGMQPAMPPGQIMHGGTRKQPAPIGDLTEPTKPQQIGLGAVQMNAKLLPSERETLKKFGWKEGEPIPVNMAELLAQGAPQAPSGVELPASSPAAERIPLSPGQVAQGTDVLADARDALEHTKAMSSMEADESVQRAMAVAAGQSPADVAIVDDTKEATYDGGEPKSEVGFEPPLLRCPRCEWDLKVRDPVEVTDGDKQRFLQAILGQVPIRKSFSVLGGAVKIVYRSLTPDELDMCFEQAYTERRQGRYQSPDAYFELINRYRLSLQLVRIESQEVNHNFPTDIPGWTAKLDTAEETDDSPVKRACEFMYKKVILTESLNRILGGLGGEFNSLVGKLEANSRNSDFWSTTKSDT